MAAMCMGRTSFLFQVDDGFFGLIKTGENASANGAVGFVLDQPFVDAFFVEAMGGVARQDPENKERTH